MKKSAHVWLLLAMAGVLVAGCSDDKSTDPPPGASRGKITATATGISLQTGNIYSVLAYAYDWSPGSNGPPVAGIRETIPADNFSSVAVLDSLDSVGNPTSEDKTLDPGTYSVVFFVSAPGSPPHRFTEVRVAVDGDKTASAPAWAQWMQP